MPAATWDQSSVTGRVLDYLRNNQGEFLTTVGIVEAISPPWHNNITLRQVFLACEVLASDETAGVIKDGTTYAATRAAAPREIESGPHEETLRRLSEYLELATVEGDQTSTQQRDSEIVRRREEGKTLYDIGIEFGLTRERVRQIIKANGGPTTTDLRRQRELLEAEEDRAVTNQIRSHLDRYGPQTALEVAKALNLTETRTRVRWPSDRKHLRLQVPHPNQSSKRWTNDQIILAIQEAATFEFPLSGTTYSELIHVGEVNGPSMALIHKRFNGWVNACDRAGVESKSAPRKNYQSKWTDTDLLDFVRDYLLDPSHTGTADGYVRWREGQRTDAPSLPTLRNRMGTWNTIKRRALGANNG